MNGRKIYIKQKFEPGMIVLSKVRPNSVLITPGCKAYTFIPLIPASENQKYVPNVLTAYSFIRENVSLFLFNIAKRIVFYHIE